MPSGEVPRGWLPEVALVASGFREVDSLASRRNPAWPSRRSRKILILSQNFLEGRWGGFKVASPVKRPDAGKLPRSAPPYTDRAGEEPWVGDASKPGPELPFTAPRVAAVQLRRSSRSCALQHRWDTQRPVSGTFPTFFNRLWKSVRRLVVDLPGRMFPPQSRHRVQTTFMTLT